MDYEQKYLKYKRKYLEAKYRQSGGGGNDIATLQRSPRYGNIQEYFKEPLPIEKPSEQSLSKIPKQPKDDPKFQLKKILEEINEYISGVFKELECCLNDFTEYHKKVNFKNQTHSLYNAKLHLLFITLQRTLKKKYDELINGLQLYYRNRPMPYDQIFMEVDNDNIEEIKRLFEEYYIPTIEIIFNGSTIFVKDLTDFLKTNNLPNYAASFTRNSGENCSGAGGNCAIIFILQKITRIKMLYDALIKNSKNINPELATYFEVQSKKINEKITNINEMFRSIKKYNDIKNEYFMETLERDKEVFPKYNKKFEKEYGTELIPSLKK